jgi:hypothetical protein
MYERFSPAVRDAMQYARELSQQERDKVQHTGHLLVGLCAVSAFDDIPELAGVRDAAARFDDLLRSPLPVQLVTTKRGLSGASDALAATIEAAVPITRQRGSKSVSVKDIVRGLLVAQPNVAVYLLQKVGVETVALKQSLGRDPN